MEFINFESSVDERRELFDWDINFPCNSIKLLYLNPGFTVGNHYHKEKDELFVLISGSIDKLQVGNKTISNVKSPAAWLVKKDIYHSYKSSNSYTLMCLASKTFDQHDDFK